MIEIFLYIAGFMPMAILHNTGEWHEDSLFWRSIGYIFWPVTSIWLLWKVLNEI